MTDELTRLAFEIADDSARASVTSYCRCNLRTEEYDVRDCDDEDREIVRDSVRYMELRGDALPYRMVRKGGKVKFEDVEA